MEIPAHRSNSAQESKNFCDHKIRFLSAFLLLTLLLDGCGSSGSEGGGTQQQQPSPPDFVLSLQASSLVVVVGITSATTISVTGENGFNSQVTVSIPGTPSGVTASPSTFELVSGGQQKVTFTAAASATPGNAAILVNSSAGSLTHSGAINLLTMPYTASPHAPTRMRYLHTDIYVSCEFPFPKQRAVYDPGTKRFFMANTAMNRVDVFDAVNQVQIEQIIVPGAYTLDENPKQGLVYVGTSVGDVYVIDPVGMAVSKRYLSGKIGDSGFFANQVLPLADGRVVLLGGPTAVDGNSEFAIWNPIDNFLESHPVSAGILTVTGDRTKIAFGSPFSDGTLTVFDPSHNTFTSVQTGYEFIQYLTMPPDGKEIIVGSKVFDANTLVMLDDIAPASGTLLSYDGNTLWSFSATYAVAYDWRTHTQKGWANSFFPSASAGYGTCPQVADETGLLFGPGVEGVAFVDGGILLNGQMPCDCSWKFITIDPTLGAQNGDTTTTIWGDLNHTTVDNVYFGNYPSNQIDRLGGTVAGGLTAVSPQGQIGAVDLTVTHTDGRIESEPLLFSFGPSVLETTTRFSTAEGGSTQVLWGYGFDSVKVGMTPANPQVSVGGQPVSVTYFRSLVPNYDSPVQFLEFAIPRGTTGEGADVTVTNSAGTTTSKGAIQYLPAVSHYPLSGSSLEQGVYDSTRDLYYFSDVGSIQAFSLPQKQWLTPITVPSTPGSRLMGLAISSDGSKLAVSDSGANRIYLLDPDVPSFVKTFSLPPVACPPRGVAVSNSGLVYYASTCDLRSVDTNTGVFTTLYSNTGYFDDASRVILSSDETRLYADLVGTAILVDTPTGTLITNSIGTGGYSELTLSGDQTTLAASDYLYNQNVNLNSYVAYSWRDVQLVYSVYGEKLNADGRLLFRPLTNAIDLVNGRTGLLMSRVGLPMTLALNNYDALVSNGKDNTLLAITGENGDGVAVIDLTSIPEPTAPDYLTTAPSIGPMVQNRGPRVRTATDLKASTVQGDQSKMTLHLTPPHLDHAKAKKTNVAAQ